MKLLIIFLILSSLLKASEGDGDQDIKIVALELDNYFRNNIAKGAKYKGLWYIDRERINGKINKKEVSVCGVFYYHRKWIVQTFDIEDGKKKREFQYVLLDQKKLNRSRTFMLPITHKRSNSKRNFWRGKDLDRRYSISKFEVIWRTKKTTTTP